MGEAKKNNQGGGWNGGAAREATKWYKERRNLRKSTTSQDISRRKRKSSEGQGIDVDARAGPRKARPLTGRLREHFLLLERFSIVYILLGAPLRAAL